MKLDALRRYRTQLEEVARIDLFRLRQELHDAEAHARRLDAHMKLAMDAYPATSGVDVTLDEFLVWQSRCSAAMAKVAAARQVEGQLRETWSQKQDALREVMQDRRKLDQLAIRRRQQRLLVQQRVEQIEMDEAARRMSVAHVYV